MLHLHKLKSYGISGQFFLLYINNLPDDVICNIAIYADDTSGLLIAML